MKIWQVEIGTEEGGSNIDVFNGTAETAQEAILKAIEFAELETEDSEGYKNPYPSRVTEIGEKVF